MGSDDAAGAPHPQKPSETPGGSAGKVLVGMSGGVDSSVAAALLVRAGYEVVGVTLKLWRGTNESGCCSVADVDDARRVAQQLGIDHLVFNFGDEFDRHVVDPYVADHSAGTTPNPCIECNRRIKFDRLLERAEVLGFDFIATGHYAQIGRDIDGALTLGRGVDVDKDQSYVVHMLGQEQLARTLFPLGGFPKSQTRRLAAELGLRTAHKPDSQDVCFIAASQGGREVFLGDRIATHPARVVDMSGSVCGEVPAVELVTIGQRRGLGLPGGGPKRYVVDVDVDARTVIIGDDAAQFEPSVSVQRLGWVDPSTPETLASAVGRQRSDPAASADPDPIGPTVMVQCSAHGRAQPATASIGIDGRSARLEWTQPQRRVAPGQSVVLYSEDNQRVLGGGIAVRQPVSATR